MIEWEEYRWIIYLAIVIAIVILLDEWAYNGWKRANPGAMFTHLKNPITPVDPSTPPFTTMYD